MGVQRCDALELGPRRAADELPRRIDGCAWPAVLWVGVAEVRQNFFSALDDVARHSPKLVHSELEVADNHFFAHVPAPSPRFPWTAGLEASRTASAQVGWTEARIWR